MSRFALYFHANDRAAVSSRSHFAAGVARFQIKSRLTAAGILLDKLSGLIIGQFTEYEENKSLGKDLYGALADLVKEYDYPICFDFPVGHVSMNVPLINGAAVTLKVGKKEVKLSFNTERE